MINGFKVQENTEVSRFNIHYLEVRQDADITKMVMSVMKFEVEPSLTKEEAEAEVDRLLHTFPYYVVDSSYPIELERRKIALQIAMQTRRGLASENLYDGNILFYTGESAMDQPILIGKHNDLYSVNKHPKFDNFGYILEIRV